MNFTSFSQVIIKALQVPLISSLLLSLCFVFGCGEQTNESNAVMSYAEVEKQALDLHSLEGIWYYMETPFTGDAIVYADNDSTVVERVGYLHGKKNGAATKWFENGNQRRASTYVENKLEGADSIWWPNGKLAAYSNFENGARKGVQKKWYNNGQLSRLTHIENGKEEGLQQAWLENGKLYVNYEAKNGRIFGLKRANLCYGLEKENVAYR